MCSLCLAPSGTLTPLFQEVERVKQTCALLALENSAATANIPNLRSETSSLREELESISVRLQEAEAVRERDVYHLKLYDDELAEKLGSLRADVLAMMDERRGDSEKQAAEAALAHVEPLRALKMELEPRFEAIAPAQEVLRRAERERVEAALGALEEREQAARSVLRDEHSSEHDALRSLIQSAANDVASSFEAVRAEHAALVERSEAQPPALRLEMASAAESVTLALEAKIVTLQSQLVRLDQKSKQQVAALEEQRDEAERRFEEAHEERSQMEARISTLELRLETVERTVERSEERAQRAAED